MEVQSRNRWTETYVKWSPLGTYLATFHTRGIALWGGEDFHQITKFSHPDVEFIEFSPCEKYIVTFSPKTSNVTEVKHWHCFVFCVHICSLTVILLGSNCYHCVGLQDRGQEEGLPL